MLVVTRREGEEVVIGDPNNPIGIVRIASIKGDRVRLAFDFPRNIPVHRKEVAENIRQEAGTSGAQTVETCRRSAAQHTERTPSSAPYTPRAIQGPTLSDPQQTANTHAP